MRLPPIPIFYLIEDKEPILLLWRLDRFASFIIASGEECTCRCQIHERCRVGRLGVALFVQRSCQHPGHHKQLAEVHVQVSCHPDGASFDTMETLEQVVTVGKLIGFVGCGLARATQSIKLFADLVQSIDDTSG